MSSPNPNMAERSDDLPEPWVRQWDDNYHCWFYINPSTDPPTTTWTHPLAKDGEAHPEQVAAQERIHNVTSQYVQENPEARQQVEDRGVGSLLGSALGGSGKHSSSSGLGSGAAIGGMGGGLGGLLLGALMNGKSSHKTYGLGGHGRYSHPMGPPPFMMGGSPFGGMGMGGLCGPFGGMGMRPMGGMGMMGGPMGMGGMGMMGPLGMGGHMGPMGMGGMGGMGMGGGFGPHGGGHCHRRW